MLQLDDLPDEMITMIMTYLSLSDRKNVRLVCKRFCYLSHSVSLTKDDITNLKKYADLVKLKTNGRKYKNIKIDMKCEINDVKTELITESFWANCGEHVKSLNLYNGSLYDPRLRAIFPKTGNLECLLVSMYDENDTCTKIQNSYRSHPPEKLPADHFKFPKLLSLDLMHFANNLICGFPQNLNSITENAPLLKRLGLEWFGLRNKSSPCLPDDFLFKFFTKQGKILKELNLSNTLLEPQQCMDWFPLIGSQLTGLYLRKCRHLTDECALEIAKRFSYLKELDLSRNSLGDESLSVVVRSLDNLTHLSLSHTRVGPLTMPLLSQKLKLVAVELSYCPKITNDSILKAFGSVIFPKLLDLRLDGAKLIDSDICALMGNFPKLTFLSLNNCRKLSDLALSTICQKTPLLRSLSIRHWTNIREVECLSDLKGLIHLDLYGCSNVSRLSKLFLLELQTLDISETSVSSAECKDFVMSLPSIGDVYVDVEEEQALKNCQHPKNKHFKFHFGYSNFTPDSIFDS